MAATETGNGDTTIERNELQPNCIGYTPHVAVPDSSVTRPTLSDVR
jgi:hypothetical protein